MRLTIALLAACMALLPATTRAQHNGSNIRAQATELATAVMNNNYEGFSRYVHPNVLAAGGGAARVRAKMDTAHQAMKRVGARFTRYWIGQPGAVVSHADELQALLPQSTTVRTPLGMLTVESTLVAISRDGGKHWLFIDTGVYGPKKLQEVLPPLHPQLVLPPRKKPKLEPLRE